MNSQADLEYWICVELIAMALLGGSFWVLTAMRAARTGYIMRDDYGPPKFWGLEDLLVFFLLYIGGNMLVWWAMTSALQMDFTEPVPQSKPRLVSAFILASSFATLSMTAFGLMYIAAKNKKSYADIGLDGNRIARDLGIGIVGFFMIIPSVLGIQFLVHKALEELLEYDHPSLKLISGQFDWFIVMSMWISAVFVAPIFEEIVYRGLLIGWLHRWLVTRNPLGETMGALPAKNPLVSEPAASWLAIGISSLLFALLHLGQGAAAIPLFVLAVALGYIYRRTGSIVPCIIIHMLLNAFSMAQVTLKSYYMNTAGTQF